MSVGLIAALAFLPGAAFEFLRFDDQDYVWHCAFVQGGLTWANVCSAFSAFTYAAVWMPLTYITYMLGVEVGGMTPAAQHVISAVVHGLNAALAFALVARLVKGASKWLIAAAVLLWAVHPMRCEAVAWIASRKELMWSLFALTTLHAHLSQRTVLSIICCALACMCKPTAMCIPLLVMCVDWMRGEKFRWWPLSVMLVLAVTTGVLAIYSQTHAEGYEGLVLYKGAMWWRLVNATNALGLYLAQTFVPLGVHLDYRACVDAMPRGVALGLPCAVALVAAMVAARRRRFIIGALAFLIIGLAPTLGIFGSFGDHARADRFTYLPMLAITLLLARGLALIPQELFRAFKLRALLIGVLITFAVLTLRNEQTFRNTFTAFGRVMECDAEHPRAHLNVGMELCARGMLKEGIGHLCRSHALAPNNVSAAQLAFALAMRGGATQEIRKLCEWCATDTTRDAKGLALDALGIAAAQEGKRQEAARYFRASLAAPKRFYPKQETQMRLEQVLKNGH